MTGIAESTPDQATGASPRPSVRSLLAATEVDVRLLGMLAALVVILVGFHFLSGGKLINPANMVTLAVQATGVAIMSTGMVLIIVSRNIDLSVGSQVGVTAMVYAVLMTDILPERRRHPGGQPLTCGSSPSRSGSPSARSSARSRDSSSPTSACPHSS